MKGFQIQNDKEGNPFLVLDTTLEAAELTALFPDIFQKFGLGPDEHTADGYGRMQLTKWAVARKGMKFQEGEKFITTDPLLIFSYFNDLAAGEFTSKVVSINNVASRYTAAVLQAFIDGLQVSIDPKDAEGNPFDLAKAFEGLSSSADGDEQYRETMPVIEIAMGLFSEDEELALLARDEFAEKLGFDAAATWPAVTDEGTTDAKAIDGVPGDDEEEEPGNTPAADTKPEIVPVTDDVDAKIDELAKRATALAVLSQGVANDAVDLLNHRNIAKGLPEVGSADLLPAATETSKKKG